MSHCFCSDENVSQTKSQSGLFSTSAGLGFNQDRCLVLYFLLLFPFIMFPLMNFFYSAEDIKYGNPFLDDHSFNRKYIFVFQTAHLSAFRNVK